MQLNVRLIVFVSVPATASVSAAVSLFSVLAVSLGPVRLKSYLFLAKV